MVDQVAARRLDHANAFEAALALGDQIGALQIGVMQQLADLFDAMHHLDHPRPVVGQRAVVHARPRTPAVHECAALAKGVSMKLAVFIRASGPTRYQPSSGPSALMKGNFM